MKRLKHSTTKKPLSLFALIFIAISMTAQDAVVKFDNISTQSGLSHGHVLCMLQDNEGFMWIGTYAGINRYDGYNFTYFTKDENGLSNNAVQDMFQDSRGIIWIGTEAGLNRFDPVTETFIVYPFNKKQKETGRYDHIRRIQEDKHGNLWLAIYKGGLCKYNVADSTFTYFRHHEDNPDCIVSDVVNNILIDNDGLVWIATEHGLSVLDPEKRQCRNYKFDPNNEHSLSDDVLSAVYQDSKGDIWVSSWHGGINKYRKETDDFQRFVHDENDPSSLPHGVIRYMFEDREGNFWLASFGGGLILFDEENGKHKVFKHDDMVPYSVGHNIIWSIYQDRSGILWVGTFGRGLSLYDKGKHKFPHFMAEHNSDNTLSSNSISAIHEDKQGYLWVGTNGHGLNRINRKTGEITHFLNNTNNSAALIRQIYEDSRERLWVGTDFGLYKYDKTRTQVAHYENNKDRPHNSIIDNGLYEIYEDSKGNIWVTSWNEGIFLLTAAESDKEPELAVFKRYLWKAETPGAISSNTTWKIFETSNGSLLFGTQNGLNKFDRETQTFDTIYGGADVSTILEDKSGSIWFGSFGRGLLHYQDSGNTFAHYTMDDGLPSMIITGMAQDEKGLLWLCTINGVSCFDPQNETFTNYDVDDGLQGSEFNLNAYAKLSNGEIAFGGNNGLNIFNPENLYTSDYKPKVVITDFKLFNKSVTREHAKNGSARFDKPIRQIEKITLKHTENVFSIEFAAFNFSKSDKNQYAYMMQGFDRDWIYTPANKRSATYTNLDGGTYTFKIKATNKDGVWNKTPVELTIEILPPYWETWWFRTLVVLIVISIAVGIYYIRMRQIREKNKELARLVKERTAELQEANANLVERQEEVLQQNEEIKSINENLDKQYKELQSKNKLIEQQNQLITGSIRYAKTIQNAVLPIKNTMDKAFESFVLYKPRDVVSGDFYWFTHLDANLPNEQIFITVVDCTGHGVPGAFMSMIGSALLNEIVRVRGIFKPSQILKLLDIEVTRILKQRQTDNTDGMELGLCRISKDKEGFIVDYAGAKRPLFYSDRKGTIVRLKGSRFGIAGPKPKHTKLFEQKSIKLYSGNMMYLTSDGFIHQNNSNRKCYGTRRFVELLNRIKDISLQEQKRALEVALRDHQKDEMQRDDITVMGIRL